MASDPIDVAQGIAPGEIVRPTSLKPAPHTEADRQEIKRLAQEFEAMLMTQMLRDMRRSMVDDDDQDESGLGAGALLDTGDVELGRALSRAGGIGLADSMLKVFEKQILALNGDTPQPDAVPSAPLVAPGASPDDIKAAASRIVDGLFAAAAKKGAADPGLMQPDAAREPGDFDLDPALLARVTSAAPVSSRFGWRQDPLSGAARFHQGIDVAVAYGADVKAAAAGTVSFAGVQNGYGHTVVIDHEGGRQTRYAHLSRETVRAGDVVEEGQLVGKSGNSGRSTGAHLHFEVLVNGQPVNPMGE